MRRGSLVDTVLLVLRNSQFAVALLEPLLVRDENESHQYRVWPVP